MRFDKLTTAFQQAFLEAESLANGRDNPYIEPQHLLAAMLQQPDGPKALLDRAGANTAALATAMDTATRNLPQVHLLWPDQLNTYDVLHSDVVLFTSAALETFLAGPIAEQTRRSRAARTPGRWRACPSPSR